MKRLLQVIKYGWKDAKKMAEENDVSRLAVYFDILRSFFKYKMWSNQYRKENFYFRSREEREKLGAEYYERGLKRDLWQKDFIANRKFIAKYSSIKYEVGRKRDKRNKAYAKQFNAGKNLFVGNNVDIGRRHYLWGTIEIGNNVHINRNTFIDYTGKLVIEDDVILTNGTIIETHSRPYHRDWRLDKAPNEPSELVIGEKAFIGSRAIIMPTCHYIGKRSRIGAGAVVTKDIPDDAVAVGVPAKVIRINDFK